MLRAIIQTISTNILVMPLGLVAGILTARFLGPSDRGLYTLLLLFPQTALLLTNLGINEATVYFHRKEKVELGSLFSNAVLYAILVGTTVSLALWWGRHYFIGNLFQNATPTHYLIAISTIPFLHLIRALNGLLKAMENFKIYNLRVIYDRLLAITGVTVVFLILRGSIVECLLVYLIGSVLISIWLLVDVTRRIKTFYPPDLLLMARLLKFGCKSYGDAMGQFLHHKFDLYLIALYLTNSEIAFYAIGSNLANRLLTMPTAIAIVIYPRLSALAPEQARDLVARACRNVVVLGGLIAVLILAFGKQLVLLLYGQEYSEAVLPMYILLVGVLLFGLTRILFKYSESINKHQYNAYIVLFSGLLNLGLNLILIPKFGILGAASSSLVTYSLQALLALYVFLRLTGVHIREILFFNTEDFRYLRRRLGLLIVGRTG